MLVKATLPLALPVACGAKLTEKEEFCPGPSVKGKVSPLTLNPVPAALALVMVTLEPPELEMLAV